jgi:5-methylcytosine-specific restriction endonuclease McrA
MSSQPEIYLAAAANSPAPENISRTLEGGVPRDRYSQHTEYLGNDPMPIWGITDGKADNYADKIHEGDILLFYTGDNARTGDKRYTLMATVQHTEWNSEIARQIWVDKQGNPGVDWPYIIYLTDLRRISISSRKLHDDLGYSASHLQDFRRVRNERIEPHLGGGTRRAYLKGLSSTYDSVEMDASGSSKGSAKSGSGGQSGMRSGSAGDTNASETTSSEEPANDISPPKRVKSEQTRIVRDTTMVKQLKQEHDHRCQVCDEQRQGPNGPYAEGHHLHPLGDDPPGPDVEENIVILCPNHHSDFDYRLIEIDPESLEITHEYEELDRSGLRTVPAHDIGSEFIEYNNRR